MAPESYKIDVPQEKLDALKTKLSLAEFPNELDAAGWDLGSPLADIKRLAKAWEDWDWRQAEAKLNQVPQFHLGVKVDGFNELDVHFVWQQSEEKNAIPLLFCHGWPGSFLEVVKLLPLLSEPGGPAFHVVAPSLPNFGFSEGVKKRGFAIEQYAETCHKLMLQLGYDQYVTQGGDWGWSITRGMAQLYPQHVKALHVNLIGVHDPPTWSANPLLALQHAVSPYSAKEKASLERTAWFEKEGRGYFMEQSTKPMTLAYALNDSPVALLAWIYEKLHDWTDSYPFTDDEIFTWISIYAFSRAGPGAAHQIYYEFMHTLPGPRAVTFATSGAWLPAKLGMAFNPKEIRVPPKTWARTLGPVVYESDNEKGGHFMAHERPQDLARDLRIMFGKGGGAFGCVEGKSGYPSGPRL